MQIGLIKTWRDNLFLIILVKMFNRGDKVLLKAAEVVYYTHQTPVQGYWKNLKINKTNIL